MTRARKIGLSLAMAAILVARYEQKTFYVQIFKILPLIHIWTMSELTLLAKILNIFLNMAHLWGFPLKENSFFRTLFLDIKTMFNEFQYNGLLSNFQIRYSSWIYVTE